MMLKTREHYDLMKQFEKEYKYMRLDREQDKGLWARGYLYEDGTTNELFKAYRNGYSFCKAV